MTVAKADTVQAIKAKFDTDVSEELTGKQLDALLAATDKPAFDALLAGYTSDGPTGQPPAASNEAAKGKGQSGSDQDAEGKKRVRLGKRAGPGTSYQHPFDKVTIGREPVLVTDDDWTAERIRHQELETA